MTSPSPTDLPIQCFADADAWRRWLEANSSVRGLWLQIAKKGSSEQSVSYAEALDVALCHGWIDGQKRGLDEDFFLQRFTPRRAKSLWSKINIGHVERLINDGVMQPGGMRQVEAARADGRWEAAYAGAASMEVPIELVAALRANAKASAAFEVLDRTDRYSLCWRIHTAKRPATRVARAIALTEQLARGEKPHP